LGFGGHRIKRSSSENIIQSSALNKEKLILNSNLKEENIGTVKTPLEDAKITKKTTKPTNIASRLPSLNSNSNSRTSNTRFQTLTEVF